MGQEIFIFNNVGNYRGNLEFKKEHGKFYWRVGCDVSDQEWLEIPFYLFEALEKFHSK